MAIQLNLTPEQENALQETLQELSFSNVEEFLVDRVERHRGVQSFEDRIRDISSRMWPDGPPDPESY